MKPQLRFFICLSLLLAFNFSFGQDSNDEKTVTKITDDLYIVSHTVGKYNNKRIGITNANMEYIIEPENYGVRHKGGRSFVISKGPKYSTFYENSLSYSRYYVTIDENHNVTSSTSYITPQNLEKVNAILKSHFGSVREYSLDELSYILEVSYGIQHLNKSEFNNQYAVSNIRLMGHLKIRTTDGNQFNIPLYFSLNSRKDQADTKFILGTPMDQPFTLFDQDFNTIAQNVENAMVGYKNDVPVFLAYNTSDSYKFDIKYISKKDIKTRSFLSPFFGFSGLEHTSIYVDQPTLLRINKNIGSTIYLDASKKGAKFSLNKPNGRGFDGNFSIEQGGVFMNPETYEEMIVTGYKNQVLLHRNGKISLPLPTNTKVNFFDFIPTKNGVLYPASVDGKSVLLDHDFKTYLSNEDDGNFKLLKYGILIKNAKNNPIGLKDFDNNIIIQPDSVNYIITYSQNVLFVERDKADIYDETIRDQIVIYHNDQWKVQEMKDIKEVRNKNKKSDYILQNHDNKMALISNVGMTILPLEYDKIINSKVIVASKKDELGKTQTTVFDKPTFAPIFTTDYEIRHDYSGIYIFNEYGVKKSGILDKNGQILFHPNKSYLSPLRDLELIYFKDSPSLTSGLLNMKGEVIFETEYGKSPQVREYKNQKIILFQTNHNSVLLVNIKGEVIDTIENARFSWNNSVKGDHLELFDLDKKYIRYNFKTKKVTKGRA